MASLESDLIRERFGMTGLPSVLSRVSPELVLAELGAFAEAAPEEKKASGSLRRLITPSV